MKKERFTFNDLIESMARDIVERIQRDIDKEARKMRIIVYLNFALIYMLFALQEFR